MFGVDTWKFDENAQWVFADSRIFCFYCIVPIWISIDEFNTVTPKERRTHVVHEHDVVTKYFSDAYKDWCAGKNQA